MGIAITIKWNIEESKFLSSKTKVCDLDAFGVIIGGLMVGFSGQFSRRSAGWSFWELLRAHKARQDHVLSAKRAHAIHFFPSSSVNRFCGSTPFCVILWMVFGVTALWSSRKFCWKSP